MCQKIGYVFLTIKCGDLKLGSVRWQGKSGPANHGTSRQGRDRALVVPTGACRAVSPHSGDDPSRDGPSGRKESGAEGFGASTSCQGISIWRAGPPVFINCGSTLLFLPNSEPC